MATNGRATTKNQSKSGGLTRLVERVFGPQIVRASLGIKFAVALPIVAIVVGWIQFAAQPFRGIEGLNFQLAVWLPVIVYFAATVSVLIHALSRFAGRERRS